MMAGLLVVAGAWIVAIVASALIADRTHSRERPD